MTDIDRWAAEILPLGEPYDPQAVADAARLTAELVRRLCHVTIDDTATPGPEHVDGVVADVKATVAGLPRLCRQLADRLQRFAGTPGLYADALARGAHPNLVIECAVMALRSAAATLHMADDDLSVAHNHTARLGVHDPKDAP